MLGPHSVINHMPKHPTLIKMGHPLEILPTSLCNAWTQVKPVKQYNIFGRTKQVNIILLGGDESILMQDIYINQ